MSGGRGGRSRLDQVMDWLAGSTGARAAGGAAADAVAAAAAAWDGVLIFDEAHKVRCCL